MWTAARAPTRPSRTSSIHSVSSIHSSSNQIPSSNYSRPPSMTSPHLSRTSISRSVTGYESDQSSDTATEDIDFASQFPAVPMNSAPNSLPAMWQHGRQQSGTAVSRLSMKFGTNTNVVEIPAPAPLRTQQRSQESSPNDDARSSSSTLGGSENEFEFPEKTPTSLPRKTNVVTGIDTVDEEEEEKEVDPPHIPGPLELQLQSLMSKLVFMERENPTVAVTPSDYEDMMAELKTLREEKKTWQKRHEALFALRDEDVENNISIRIQLAKARRDLEGMTKLRDDDLVNLQLVRGRLADATRKLDQTGGSANGSGSVNGRSSPSRARPGSMMMERRGTMDLFAVAKAAALEQRCLELEKRNGDLLSQVETLKSTAPIDNLNSLTAHKAWKDTVADLEGRVKAKDAEISRLRSGSGAAAAVGATSGTEWQRVEALHEEHATYRERVGGKMQQLRSEKESLQREVHRKEDECHVLEARVQSLQRRLGAAA
ncbi:hypothetical protein P154DRAFT_517132 [Amniculicola lignicola CBS 123094]|uniref:Uncharacterized protein n=1 Tax=Amniculicola lignicola CBS 123094 TaxID=1392246 RepID=A0A6A5X3A2_9PLEO|nr:hypothetical protein P154DRAFT_517132 [Amniculicola lignicola CBS 123094]